MTRQAEVTMTFIASIDAWQDRLRARLAEFYLHVILLFFQNVVIGGDLSPGTPVDSGYARNSWIVGLNGVGEFRQPATNPHPPPRRKDGERDQVYPTVSVDEAQTTILDVQLGDTVYISSNASYMLALENGHSDQAPTGMVALAILGAQVMVDQVAREMLS